MIVRVKLFDEVDGKMKLVQEDYPFIKEKDLIKQAKQMKISVEYVKKEPDKFQLSKLYIRLDRNAAWLYLKK